MLTSSERPVKMVNEVIIMISGTYVNKDALGKAIKDYRTEKKISQEDLAKSLHTQKSSISSYENGHSLPSLENAVQLAQMLGISIEELAGYDVTEIEIVRTYGDLANLIERILRYGQCLSLEENSQGEPQIVFEEGILKEYFKTKQERDNLFHNKRRNEFNDDEIRQEALYRKYLLSLKDAMKDKPIY